MSINQLVRLALAGAFVLPAYAADVTVQIRLAATDALEVSDELPDRGTRPAFQQTGDSYRQFHASWQAGGECGKVEGNALRPNYRTVRFRVPASTENLGGFPGAFYAAGIERIIARLESSE